MNTLQEKLQRTLQSALDKKASESDEALIAAAEKTPNGTSISSPEAGQTGAASDIITDSVGADGLVQPGTSSEITDVNAEAAPAGGVDGTVIEGNKDGEAAKVLNIKDGEVTKEEGIDMINKAANAVRNIGARLIEGLDEQVIGAFQKQASAPMSAQEMLIKAASEGDVVAQNFVDFLASYELGMAKKANDLEEAVAASGATDPEQVAELEDALNAAAIEDPESLEVEGEVAPEAIEGEMPVEDPEVMAALEEVGAEIEAAAQEATIEVAEAIITEDPSISEEEALTAAQEVVADALMTMDAQQALGAMGEDGEYVVGDEDAAQAVDELAKTASANPMRGAVVAQLNAKFGLTPDAFAKRLGF
jgi:hypothetical protein